MNQPKQAQLLVPCLILIAFGVACGGTVEYQQAGPNPSDPAPAGAGGTAGSAIAKPQPIMSAGAGGTIVSPVKPQPMSGQPACPMSMPQEGSVCGSSNYPDSYACNYDDQFSCERVSAECYHGTWNLLLVDSLCGFAGAAGEAGAPGIPIPSMPPVPLTCPSGIPQTGTSCYLPSTVSSYRCDYADVCTQYLATCTGIWLVNELFECAGAGGA